MGIQKEENIPETLLRWKRCTDLIGTTPVIENGVAVGCEIKVPQCGGRTSGVYKLSTYLEGPRRDSVSRLGAELNRDATVHCFSCKNEIHLICTQGCVMVTYEGPVKALQLQDVKSTYACAACSEKNHGSFETADLETKRENIGLVNRRLKLLQQVEIDSLDREIIYKVLQWPIQVDLSQMES